MYSDVATEVSDMEHVHCIVQWLYSHVVYMCITPCNPLMCVTCSNWYKMTHIHTMFFDHVQ